MKELFIQIVNMSITASWLVFVIALIRLVFKKAPKSMICFLWLFVAIRLIVPFSFESALSLIPSTQVIPDEIIEVTPNPSVNVQSPSDGLGNETQIVIPNQDANSNVSIPSVEQNVPVQDEIQWLEILPWCWICGILMMVGYAAYSYQKIVRQVQISINKEENIWICDDLSSPFILGVLKPRIYVPSYLSETEIKYVLAHEKAHLKRFDHLWKPLGYTLLSIYWFNPVLWAAYLLLCSDIELACDEKVIKTLGDDNKVEYSKTLLSCSVPRSMILACPLAFGEVSVKQRVKSVLNYKKPAFWVLCVAMAICIALPVFFLSDPERLSNKTLNGLYKEMISETSAVVLTMQVPTFDTHMEQDFSKGQNYHKVICKGVVLAAEEREQFSQVFQIIDEMSESVQNEDINNGDVLLSFEINQNQIMSIQWDKKVKIQQGDEISFYQLENDQFYQLKNWIGNYLLSQSQGNYVQSYVNEILMDEKVNRISYVSHGQSKLGIQIHAASDAKTVLDMKPVLVIPKNSKFDVGLYQLSLAQMVEKNDTQSLKKIVECDAQSAEACQISMMNNMDYFLYADMIWYYSAQKTNGTYISYVLRFDPGYFGVSYTDAENLQVESMTGEISELVNQGTKAQIQLKTITETSPMIEVSSEQIKGYKEEDCARVVFYTDTTTSETVLMSIEPVEAIEDLLTFDYFSTSYEGLDWYSFRHDNPNIVVDVKLPPGTLKELKLGDIVHLKYIELEVPTADSYKMATEYLLISAEKEGRKYTEALRVNDYVTHPIDSIKLVMMGYEGEKTIELRSDSEITQFLQQVEDIPVYTDYVEIFGAGGHRYQMIFVSDSGQQTIVDCYFNIEIIQPDGTTIHCNHTLDATEGYYGVIDRYFEE